MEWLVVELPDRKETEIFNLFPICNTFMLNSHKPQNVVLVAGVFGAGNATSAVLTAFLMATQKEPYAVASERISRVAQKAMPHAAHFVEQLELSAPPAPALPWACAPLRCARQLTFRRL